MQHAPDEGAGEAGASAPDGGLSPRSSLMRTTSRLLSRLRRAATAPTSSHAASSDTNRHGMGGDRGSPGRSVRSRLRRALAAARATASFELTGAQLEDVPVDLIRSAQETPLALKRVDLSHNRLTHVHTLVLFSPSLTWLNLRGNRMPAVNGFMELFGSLRFLDLSGNRISEVSPVLGHLSALTDLNLSHNCLRSLPSRMFRYVCPSVTRLSLAHNQLTEVPEDMGRWTCLRQLDLSHNHLSALPHAMAELVSLVTLSVAHNSITLFPPSLSLLPNLASIVVHHNPVLNVPASTLLQTDHGDSDTAVLTYLRHRRSVPTDASRCDVMGLANAAPVCGRVLCFTVNTVDTEGKRLTCGGDVITVGFVDPLTKELGPELPDCTVADLGTGQYRILWTPQRAGPALVGVLVNDKPVGSGEWWYRVEVAPAAVAPQYCTVDARDASLVGRVEQPCVFTVTAHDVYGNVVSGMHEVSATMRVPPTPVDLALGADGVFHGSFTPLVLGSHFLEVTMNGHHVKGSPLRFRVFGDSAKTVALRDASDAREASPGSTPNATSVPVTERGNPGPSLATAESIRESVADPSGSGDRADPPSTVRNRSRSCLHASLEQRSSTILRSSGMRMPSPAPTVADAPTAAVPSSTTQDDGSHAAVLSPLVALARMGPALREAMRLRERVGAGKELEQLPPELEPFLRQADGSVVASELHELHLGVSTFTHKASVAQTVAMRNFERQHDSQSSVDDLRESVEGVRDHVLHLCNHLESVQTIYDRQSQGMQHVWPFLTAVKMNSARVRDVQRRRASLTPSQRLERSHDDIHRLWAFLEWRLWFVREMGPAMTRVNDLLLQLEDALDHEMRLATQHRARLQEGGVNAERAVEAVYHARQHALLEMERLSLGSLCGHSLRQYYGCVADAMADLAADAPTMQRCSRIWASQSEYVLHNHDDGTPEREEASLLATYDFNGPATSLLLSDLRALLSLREASWVHVPRRVFQDPRVHGPVHVEMGTATLHGAEACPGVVPFATWLHELRPTPSLLHCFFHRLLWSMSVLHARLVVHGLFGAHAIDVRVDVGEPVVFGWEVLRDQGVDPRVPPLRAPEMLVQRDYGPSGTHYHLSSFLSTSSSPPPPPCSHDLGAGVVDTVPIKGRSGDTVDGHDDGHDDDDDDDDDATVSYGGGDSEDRSFGGPAEVGGQRLRDEPNMKQRGVVAPPRARLLADSRDRAATLDAMLSEFEAMPRPLRGTGLGGVSPLPSLVQPAVDVVDTESESVLSMLDEESTNIGEAELACLLDDLGTTSPIDAAVYGASCDVWAVGSVLWHALKGEPLSLSGYTTYLDERSKPCASSQHEPSDPVLKALHDLMHELLDVDAEHRLTAIQACDHDAFWPLRDLDEVGDGDDVASNGDGDDDDDALTLLVRTMGKHRTGRIKVVHPSALTMDACVDLYCELDPSCLWHVLVPVCHEYGTVQDRMPRDMVAHSAMLYGTLSQMTHCGLMESFGRGSGAAYLPAQGRSDERAYEALGRMLAKCIIDGITLPFRLSSAFFAHALDRTPTIADLEAFRPELALDLLLLMVNPVAESPFVDDSWLDDAKQRLNDHNKVDFFEHTLHTELVGCRSIQMDSMKRGFAPLLTSLHSGPLAATTLTPFRLMCLAYRHVPLDAQRIADLVVVRCVVKTGDSAGTCTETATSLHDGVFLRGWLLGLTRRMLRAFVYTLTRQCYVDSVGIVPTLHNPDGRIHVYLLQPLDAADAMVGDPVAEVHPLACRLNVPHASDAQAILALEALLALSIE